MDNIEVYEKNFIKIGGTEFDAPLVLEFLNKVINTEPPDQMYFSSEYVEIH